MNRGAVVRLYIKMFLLAGIPFGVVIGLYDAIMFSPSGSALLGGLLAAVAFGAVMSAVAGTRQLRSARKSVYTDPADLGVRQRARVRLTQPRQQAFAAAQQALEGLPARITGADAASGRISGKTGMSWQSWGENLTLTVESDASNGSSVLIESRPRFPVTIADYGVGRTNVEHIAAALTYRINRGR